MTTQKVQSKIKSSTIAITVLSILLAVAVASTIVLAAFSTSKSATTTITFGGGLDLTLSSPAASGSFQAGSLSGSTLTISPEASAVFSDQITIPTISGNPTMAAYVGYKVTVTSDGVTFAFDDNAFTATVGTATLTVTVNAAQAFEAIDGVDGGYVTTNALAANTAAEMVGFVITATDYNQVTSRSVTIAIDFYAEDSVSGTKATVSQHFSA